MKKYRVFNDNENYFIDRFFSTREEAANCILNAVAKGDNIDNYTIKEVGMFCF